MIYHIISEPNKICILGTSKQYKFEYKNVIRSNIQSCYFIHLNLEYEDAPLRVNQHFSSLDAIMILLKILLDQLGLSKIILYRKFMVLIVHGHFDDRTKTIKSKTFNPL